MLATSDNVGKKRRRSKDPQLGIHRTVSSCSSCSEREESLLISNDQSQPGYGAAEQDEASAQEEKRFNKAMMHASVLDTYSVCCALTTGFCVCTIFINHDDVAHELRKDPLRYFALLAHQILVRICTALGIYAMLVFMLAALYSKTALSRHTYGAELYQYFKQKTGTARIHAFSAMYWSCMMYLVSIALSLFYSVHGVAAGVSAMLVALILFSLRWETKTMLNVAGILFQPDAAMCEKLEKAGYKCEPQP